MLLRHRSDKVKLLKTVSLFSDLSKRHLEMIAEAGQERRILEGRVIARQGSPGGEVFIIVEGTARVERDGRLVARLKEGDCFGEMSLIDGEPRSATVTAESDVVVVLVVAASKFHALMESAPALSRSLLATLSKRLRSADIQLATRN